MSDSAMANTTTTEQPTSIQKCALCDYEYRVEDRFFRCFPCQRGEFSACQACVLKETFSTEGHHPRPCFLDPRDDRTTFLPAPDISSFRAMVADARTDCSLKFPRETHKFLSRSSIEGVSTERFASSDTYYQKDDEFYAPTLKHTIPNDYSLYEKLDTNSKDIRLLQILQGSPQDEITVLLGRFASPWDQIPFMALSYRWGALDETRSVSVIHMANRLSDGNEPQYKGQSLAVTANLEIALRTLRRPDSPTWFWIDAICINQGDLQERADQVRIMAEIYACASSTVVWLETDAEEGDSLQYIRGFSALLKQTEKEDPATDQFSYAIKLVNRARLSVNGKEVDHTDMVKKMAKLFRNSWFTRVWVLQEIAYTTSMAYVLSNVAAPALPWNELVVVQNYLVAANRYLKAGVNGLPSPWRDIEASKTKGALPIMELFAQVSHDFDATDQRDKLFSLLSIAKETRDFASLSPLIQPNYKKSITQVFADFTRWCILHQQSLQVLGYVTYSDRTGFPAGEGRKIPSWAWSPQQKFRKHQHVLCLTEEFRAAADLVIDFSLLEDHHEHGSLQLRGYRLATIVGAEKFYFNIRWDAANEMYLQNEGSNEFYFGGIHWLWRSACGPGAKHAQFCEPLSSHGMCSGKLVFHEFLLMLTCGGMKRHGDCDHSKDIHRTRWLQPTEMYEMFATYWINHGANWADPDMELFCPHVRELLQPLAGRGDPEAFAQLLIGNATRKTLIIIEGKAGLGPPGTQKGDVIVALFGGRAPFVLRPRQAKESDEQEWEFIGECFMNDFMKGKQVQDKIDKQEPSEVFRLC